ncbi:hypothetical protein IFM89_036634 [Coptis chinensis]|uniref:non-specific serine/threonine protein kinase n=1 Tax=Coptis chinensis TaxID=261450 RepID=A0A835LTV6_9MAGN|nr:hypothetical protein IFM89_036634 [Coptis chinensis]
MLHLSAHMITSHSKADGLLHTACGTPNYVAPEVLNDKGYDGTTADIWSCGVILFVLMAGYLPFVESNLISLYRKINKADFTCPSWFSPGIKNLIKASLTPILLLITIPDILENEWFKKGYRPPDFEQGEDVSLDDVVAVFNDSKEYLVTEKKEKPVSMNAFEFISRSQCFNLGSLFEKQEMKLKGDKIWKKGPSLRPATEKGELVLETTTEPDGFFIGGPLYDDVDYDIEPSKGYDRSLWLMQGMFRANRGCGYVKKPEFLLKVGPHNEVFDPRSSLPVKQILKVGIARVPADSVMKKTKTIEDNWTPPNMFAAVRVKGRNSCCATVQSQGR